jgi:uncharacterized protein YjbI with pentapeptide repeats
VSSCGQGGCSATAVADGSCLEHASEQDLELAAQTWEAGTPLDARGGRISGEAVKRLLAVLNGRHASSEPIPFMSDGRGPAELCFEGAEFFGPVDFSGVKFRGPALFDGAIFHENAKFDSAKFEDHADFDNVEFQGSVSFDRAIFEDHAGFQDATFEGTASFAGVRFRNHADFEWSTFRSDASFEEATFQLSRRLGPLLAEKRLAFDDCVFGERILIEVEAKTLSARAAIFADGVRLSVRRAAIFLSEADFGRASTLSSPTDPLTEANSIEENPREDCQARLITIRGAQVARLSLSDLDLRACRFFGAHGLESLIVESSCEWPRTPPGLRIDREIIAEEHHWRRERRSRFPKWPLGRRQWAAHATDPCDWPDSRSRGEPLDPQDLATLYRALRKAREDNKDQAGAGDLYYGEMEMRRVTPIPSGRGKMRALCDRAIIISYWLLSGYGLKASRAFFAWLCVIVAAGFGLYHWGIVAKPSHPRAAPIDVSQAMLFSLENTSSLIRLAHLPGAYELRLSGQIIQVVIRLAGPLLIGLWLLALRARVKR